jgi:putative membrane protein
MGGYNGFMYGGGFMWIFWILLIVLLAVAIGALVRRGGSTGLGGREHTALDILKERYARGEIDRNEFEQKRRDLGG